MVASDVLFLDHQLLIAIVMMVVVAVLSQVRASAELAQRLLTVYVGSTTSSAQLKEFDPVVDLFAIPAGDLRSGVSGLPRDELSPWFDAVVARPILVVRRFGLSCYRPKHL